MAEDENSVVGHLDQTADDTSMYNPYYDSGYSSILLDSNNSGDLDKAILFQKFAGLDLGTHPENAVDVAGVPCDHSAAIIGFSQFSEIKQEDSQPCDFDLCMEGSQNVSYEENCVRSVTEFQEMSPTDFEMWCFQPDEDGDNQLLLALIHLMTPTAIHFVAMTTNACYLNLQNSIRQTALHLAVITKQCDVIKALMAAGADCNLRDRHGNTPIHIACEQGSLDCVMELSGQGTPQQEHIKAINFSHKISPELFNYQGYTCLHLAAAGGHINVIHYLLQNHVCPDVNIPDGRSGRTILHHAAEARDIRLIFYLINQAELNINARTFSGSSALHLAMGRQYGDVANFLVSAGATDEQVVPDLWESSTDDSDLEMEQQDSMTNGHIR